MVISMKFYILDKEKMVEVQKTLAERKKEVEAMEAEAAKESSDERKGANVKTVGLAGKQGQAGSLFPFAGNGVL